MSAPIMEQVKYRDANTAWAEVLKLWREREDAAARAENALLKHMIFHARREFQLHVEALAA